MMTTTETQPAEEAVRSALWRVQATVQRHIGLVIASSCALVVVGVAGIIVTDG